MKNLASMGLKYENKRLLVLNQQVLPQQEEWIISNTIDEMIQIIKTLKVRGAPLIGVAAALALAQYAEQEETTAKQIINAANQLKQARPTAVNLSFCIDRLLACYQKSNADRQVLIKEAEIVFEEDAKLCHDIINHGEKLIAKNDSVLTHCNTGGLVTTGIGTALGIIIHSHKQGKNPHVFVDETRPLLQGGRLTAWECVKNGISHQIICDNMAASLMREGKINKIFVGADRIAANGDFANKIGTYNLAVLAYYHKIPFYVAAPYTTVDLQCKTGKDICIEERHPDEIKGVMGAFGKVTWSPQESQVYNPAFDVTPVDLITAIILDSGCYSPLQFQQTFSF
ncbi:MAG: S-methyl-5-thioribose-1-phosphate isomerase [Gammaproteobacteria bacterium RIFCSPHIGHO2_12_FULL_35_23]|nr:MAG: S-methyl-5-thioribose-1-phosphate isomerase [Gammaproteobacteria bacterium RIFCSPHIGHO2_12_FULL_35_23]